MIHFSVDDTIDIFKNLTYNNYQSCFEEPVLSFFKELSLKYGFKVSLYCFYEDDYGFNLSGCTEKYRDEFKGNSDWLKFGFHARNRKSDYSKCSRESFLKDIKEVYDSLKKIVSEEALTYNVRLGFGKGTEECIKVFKLHYPQFSILYGVDDERIEYHLTNEENNLLLENGNYYHKRTGITVKLSELRLEKQTNLEDYLNTMQKRESYAFFTHEVHLENKNVKESIVKLSAYTDGFII